MRSILLRVCRKIGCGTHEVEARTAARWVPRPGSTAAAAAASAPEERTRAARAPEAARTGAAAGTADCKREAAHL